MDKPTCYKPVACSAVVILFYYHINLNDLISYMQT